MNKILIYPDPLLRKKSQLINKVGYKEKKLSKNMFEIMKESIGIGLAAPQIGELKRIKEPIHLFHLIPPELRSILIIFKIICSRKY